MKAIKSKRIVTPSAIVDGYLIYEEGKIVSIQTQIDDSSMEVDDIGNQVLMPGIIDCHVHINEPGRAEWEGFETATKAAAAGGITTLIEMPLNASPVTTTVENFELKIQATAQKLYVNCGFWGGVVPSNLQALDALLRAGTFGLKAFLTHSGIDEFPNTNEAELRSALQVLKQHQKPLLVHCELTSAHEDESLFEQDRKSYSAYLKSRPKKWENDAVELMIRLCRETGAQVHIVHVSSDEALAMIAAAKAEGLPLSAETCPHYLYFDAESIPDGNTVYKCAPPIREKQNNQHLWQALRSGILDFVVTDHSPATPSLKEIESGDLKKAWGGISSLQFLLPAFYTKATSHHIDLMTTSKLLSENTSKLIGLDHCKGKLAAGYDADMVVWDPEEKFVVTSEMIYHRHQVTPYLHEELSGVVKRSYLAGEIIYQEGKVLAEAKGKVLYRKS